ncbi:MAG: signal peptidase I [Acidimicrobiales bacterium]
MTTLLASEDTDAPLPARRRAFRSGLEWVAVVVVALAAALLVKTFVLQTFYIPSGSMEPTLQINDRVFVNKLAYDFHPIHRGDIVVFTPTPAQRRIIGPGIDDLIKRVIGLPGETIQGIGNRVYIDGKPLSEPYLAPGVVPTAGAVPLYKQKIPPHEYFLMGDNRADSKDSRYFGPVNQSQIVGRAFLRVWPLSRLGFI